MFNILKFSNAILVFQLHAKNWFVNKVVFFWFTFFQIIKQ